MGTSAGSSVASDTQGLVFTWAQPGLYDLVAERSDQNRAPLTVQVPVNPLDVGGGSSPGAPVVRRFPFAFNTPGILTGAALYTPTIGDVLFDAWLEIDTAWDGTTPLGDWGTFDGSFRTNMGWFQGQGLGPIDMTQADFIWGSFKMGTICNDALLHAAVENSQEMLQSAAVASTPSSQAALVFNPAQPGTPSSGERILPLRIITPANPIKVVVSQDGTNTGADPDSTQGSAVLYLVTATPA